MKLNYGDIAAQKVSERIAALVATVAELKTIPADRRVDGMRAIIAADNSRWRFHGTSALTGDDLLVIAPSAGSGVWLREPGGVDLKIPIAFGTLDAAVLFTAQAGQRFWLQSAAWEVTADFTGGASSAIGLSSNKATPTAWTTKGDILGGATGDVAATLTAANGLNVGTIGTDMDTLAKIRGLILVSGNTIKFDRITSAFTAGTGFVHLMGILLNNDGA